MYVWHTDLKSKIKFLKDCSDFLGTPFALLSFQEAKKKSKLSLDKISVRKFDLEIIYFCSSRFEF
jgi:hypothetical protein